MKDYNDLTLSYVDRDGDVYEYYLNISKMHETLEALNHYRSGFSFDSVEFRILTSVFEFFYEVFNDMCTGQMFLDEEE